MSGEAQQTKKASWAVIGMLAAAQFVMVLDTTVMNVSISEVVADLGTTVVGLQAAITTYTLVMASLMLFGGKLGSLWGAKRAFAIGMLIYGTGSFITAIAPSLGVLMVGWSLIEGMGAALVIPAIAALIVTTYEGKQRVLAYGILGGVTGASAAAGPLIGGWIGTVASWRWVFAGEAIVVVVLLLMLALIPATTPKPGKVDVVGTLLSVLGLGLGVFAILKSSQWGWILPGPRLPMIGERELAPLGLSPTMWLLVVSGLVLAGLLRHEQKVKARGDDPLFDIDLLRIFEMRAGLMIFAAQQFMVMATFFVIPMYLQTVLGFDAFETGVAILPLSVALLVFALAGAALASRFAPRHIVSAGVVLLTLGEVVMLAFIEEELASVGFGAGLALVGSGFGLLASQLGNIIMSSAPPGRSGEAGGLQGTAQNLGASLGTALIGSVLIATLATSFGDTLADQPGVPPEVQLEASRALTASANFVTTDAVATAVADAGLSGEEAAGVVTAYGEAQLLALRGALAAIALFGLIVVGYVQALQRRIKAALVVEDESGGTPDE